MCGPHRPLRKASCFRRFPGFSASSASTEGRSAVIHVPLVCGLSQGSSVREHGDEPPDLGWLKRGRMKDGTRSAGESPAAIRARPSLASVLLSEFLQAFSVAVRTFAEKGSGPLAEVEDMVAKTHMDGPFRKFRGRPPGKVAISSCGRPWNSYDIARRLYGILRIATLLFILLNCFC